MTPLAGARNKGRACGARTPRKARMPCATDAPLAHDDGAKLPVLPTPTRAQRLLVSNRSQLAALSTNTKRRLWLQLVVRLVRADVGASRLEHTISEGTEGKDHPNMTIITWGWTQRGQRSVAKAAPQGPTTWSRRNTCPSTNASYEQYACHWRRRRADAKPNRMRSASAPEADGVLTPLGAIKNTANEDQTKK